MWPGRRKSSALVSGSASAVTVRARSSADTPVVVPSRASTDTVNAVRFDSVFCSTICGSWSWSSRSPVIGWQMIPLVWRIMKASFSGVAFSAAMIRSPSFSRFSSSATITSSPAAMARRPSSIEAVVVNEPSCQASLTDWLTGQSMLRHVPTIRVEHEGAVVGRVVVLAETGRAVVLAARGERRLVEAVNAVAVCRVERDVDRTRRRVAAAGDPELRTAGDPEADDPALLGEVHGHAHPERLEHPLVEGAGSVQVVHLDDRVVEGVTRLGH